MRGVLAVTVSLAAVLAGCAEEPATATGLCGDGIAQGLEECDDGNRMTGDACTNLCLTASCGDGVVFWDEEQCDDGIGNTSADPRACQPDCTTCQCSNLVECSFAGDSFACTDCPPGYHQTDGPGYEVHCDPRLVDLSVVGGVLDAAFDPERFAYTVTVDASVTSVAFVITAPDGVSIEVNRELVESGQATPPASVRFGTNPFLIELNGGYITYAVLVQKAMDVTFIKASNADPDDYFGSAVALDGDTLAVGAYGEASAATGIDGDQADNSAPGRGAVYVLRFDGVGWAQEAYLKPVDPGHELFGVTVALDGDTLVIGGSSAVVYVYRRTGLVWALDAQLDAGCRPEVDVDGDTLVLGCWATPAVTIFRRDDTAWSPEATLTSDDATEGFGFGHGLTLDGDLLAFVGTKEVPDDLGGSVSLSRVLVFRRAGTLWTEDASLCPTTRCDFMDLAIDGDRLAITAPSVNANNELVIVRRDLGAWSLEASFTRSEQFGLAVALDGDLVAVTDAGPLGIGGLAVRTYTWTAAGWAAAAYLAHSDVLDPDDFGESLGVSGNLLGGGAGDDASGARGVGGDPFDTTAPFSGAVHAIPLP